MNRAGTFCKRSKVEGSVKHRSVAQEPLTDWSMSDLLQFQQQVLELVHYSEDGQSLLGLLWKTKAWFTPLDLSHCRPHGLDLLLNLL